MREESAFDANVVSWADAYGLMQLIMPTAKGVAQSLKMKVDESSLKRPEVKIQLGCKLLGNLRGVFPSAPVMAIPSHNAGAGATKRWLGSRTSDDFDL
jgi:soluble lytic murein transglycosylase